MWREQKGDRAIQAELPEPVMTEPSPLDRAAACRRLASLTRDPDRQALLLFLARCWRRVAETGDVVSARPAFLGEPGGCGVRGAAAP
jgi:hypothetical protein